MNKPIFVHKYVFFFLLLATSFINSFFLPWWSGLAVAFVLGFLLGNTPISSFLSGFLALSMVWIVLALLKSLPNENILAARVSHLFNFHRWIYLLFLTGFIGGLFGGMASLSGFLLKKAFRNPKFI